MELNKKVYLVNISRNLNQVQMNIGLAVLTNALKLNDIGVEYIDLIPIDIEERDSFFQSKLPKEPAIYGFGIIMGNNHLGETERYAKKILNVNPNNIIIYGGPLPSAVPEIVLKNCMCNYVLKGEGESSFPKLVKSLLKGDFYPSEIPGLCYKKEGKIILSPNAMIRKLDQYSKPDYSQFDMDFYINYLKETDQSFELMASRGCAYNCSFCYKVCGQGISIRDPDDVLDEIEEIMLKYNIQKFYFVDENFFAVKRFFREFVDKKQARKLDFIFIVQTRIDSLDKELCILARDNGLTCISTAIESASQETLNKVNKRTKIEDIENKIELLRELGIRMTTEFIIGFPWDTIEGYNELIEFIKRNKLERTFKLSYLTPLPGTKLYEEVLNNGLIKDEFEYLNSLGDIYWERMINLTSLPDDVLDHYYNKIASMGKRHVVYPKDSKYLNQIKEIH